MRIGVPIPRGVLADAPNCSLVGPQGDAVPHQCRVLGRWSDRSVKWLLVDALVTVAAGQRMDLALRRGPVAGSAVLQSLWVYEGSVKFFNTQGSLQLNAGEAAQALLGQTPHTQLDVKPLDAVQWALYYPTIIDPRVIEQQLPQALQATIRESLAHYRHGNAFEALAALEGLDSNTLNPQLLTYRAGLYLTFGRVAEARNDIALALQTQPNDSAAYALQAIIAVVQNDKETALQHAQQAVDIDRTSQKLLVFVNVLR